MKVNEKTEKKDTAALIIRKYQQYLKLEKSLSKNTLDAYMTDLDKLLNFLQSENIEISDVCLDDLLCCENMLPFYFYLADNMEVIINNVFLCY